MKKLLVIISALASAIALPSISAGTFVSNDVWTEYVSSHAATFYDGPVSQLFVSHDIGKGVYATYFNSISIDRRPSYSRDYSGEMDFGLGWSENQAIDSTGRPVKVDVSVSYWDLYPVLTSGKRDVWAFNVSLSRDTGCKAVTIRTVLCLEAYVPVNRSFWGPGWRGTAGWTFSKEVTKKASLFGSVKAVRDDGTLSGRPVTVVFATAGIAWKANGFTVSFPEIKALKVVGKVQGHSDHLVAGIGASKSF